MHALVRFNKNGFVGLVFVGPTIGAMVSTPLVLVGSNLQFFISSFFHLLNFFSSYCVPMELMFDLKTNFGFFLFVFYALVILFIFFFMIIFQNEHLPKILEIYGNPG